MIFSIKFRSLVIEFHKGETVNRKFELFDLNSNPVDLSGFDLRFFGFSRRTRDGGESFPSFEDETFDLVVTPEFNSGRSFVRIEIPKEVTSKLRLGDQHFEVRVLDQNSLNERVIFSGTLRIR